MVSGDATLGNLSPKEYAFLSFDQAKIFVKKLKFKSSIEWEEYCASGKRPTNIPSSPSSYYRNDGWVSWGDFLGTGNTATYKRSYRSFIMARKFAHSLKLADRSEWRRYCASGKKPDDIPSTPYNVYKNEGLDILARLAWDKKIISQSLLSLRKF